MDRFKNVVLRKCKSLSRGAAGRPSSSSYCNLRSMSTRDAAAAALAASAMQDDDDAAAGTSSTLESGAVVVLVGSSRRRYVISAERLGHPLIATLIEPGAGGGGDRPVAVKCEVVLFDHLLWMLDNADDLRAGDGKDDDDDVRELAQLYAC